MNEQELLDAITFGESKDWEFKSARGGMPQSLWETYSAMANTDGGVIVLGVSQKNGHLIITGLDAPEVMRRNFWNTINDHGKVSGNLLVDNNVSLTAIDGKTLMAIQVPRANRRQRPLFVGQNPLTGTYRRNHEGDYHCTAEEVARMLADQSYDPADSRIVEHFGLDDLDMESLRQYRQLFSASKPDHPWLTLEMPDLLKKLGAWRTERGTGITGITVAGLLLFGKDEAIRDPAALPGYQVDYRERLSEDPEVRWSDRLTVDGIWQANLFQFFQRVMQRLTRDLKIPFRLEPNLYRRDTTIVHEALREAVVNALIHADYRGMGGIVIEKYRSRIELSNPGSLLVSYDQLLSGGISECRNKSLQLMFQLIGAGDKAGSGIDKILQGWKTQQWRAPEIEELVQPDRVRLVLTMESLLPEESISRLRARFGTQLDILTPLELETLATAEIEAGVSNARMRMTSETHTSDLTRMLQSLVARGFLVQQGQKRGTFYVIPLIHSTAILNKEVGNSLHSDDNSLHSDNGSLHSDDNSLHSDDSSLHSDNSSLHSDDNSIHYTPEESLRNELVEVLRSKLNLSLQEFGESFYIAFDVWVHDHLPADDIVKIADISISFEAWTHNRLAQDHIRRIILYLCARQYLTVEQIGTALNRNPAGVRLRYLTPMVLEGILSLKYPLQPNRPDQAYTAKSSGQGKEDA